MCLISIDTQIHVKMIAVTFKGLTVTSKVNLACEVNEQQLQVTI
jgi:hypothetical protein